VTLICASLAVASGCGNSNEKFSSAEADRALAALDSVQEYVDAGRCARARSKVNTLAVQSTHVNDDRPQLGEAYASSVARLQTLVDRECVEIKADSPTPSTAETGTTGEASPTPPVEPTGGGETPATPGDGTGNGNGNGNPGGNGNGKGNGKGNGNGNQTPGPDDTPPADSGGAGPGT
jgi:hypothetical protein